MVSDLEFEVKTQSYGLHLRIDVCIDLLATDSRHRGVYTLLGREDEQVVGRYKGAQLADTYLAEQVLGYGVAQSDVLQTEVRGAEECHIGVLVAAGEVDTIKIVVATRAVEPLHRILGTGVVGSPGSAYDILGDRDIGTTEGRTTEEVLGILHREELATELVSSYDTEVEVFPTQIGGDTAHDIGDGAAALVL